MLHAHRPARYGLVILGNPKVLAKQPLWHVLLTHFKERSCLAEGPLTSLRPSALQLPPRTRAFDGRSFALGTHGTTRYAAQIHGDDDTDNCVCVKQCAERRVCLYMLCMYFTDTKATTLL